MIYLWYSNNMCSFRMIFFCFHPNITFVLKYIPLTFTSIFCFLSSVFYYFDFDIQLTTQLLFSSLLLNMLNSDEYLIFHKSHNVILFHRYISSRFSRLRFARFHSLPHNKQNPPNTITIPTGSKKHPKLWQYALNILIHSLSPFILLFRFHLIRHQINVQ